jgi:hypothetical protein
VENKDAQILVSTFESMTQRQGIKPQIRHVESDSIGVIDIRDIFCCYLRSRGVRTELNESENHMTNDNELIPQPEIILIGI